MDIEDVNKLNNLPENVTLPNNTSKLGENGLKPEDIKVPETSKPNVNNNDVLDPESNSGTDHNSSFNNNGSKNGEETRPEGETEDVLDPEAEKKGSDDNNNEKKKEKKKEDKKEENNDADNKNNNSSNQNENSSNNSDAGNNSNTGNNSNELNSGNNGTNTSTNTGGNSTSGTSDAMSNGGSGSSAPSTSSAPTTPSAPSTPSAPTTPSATPTAPTTAPATPAVPTPAPAPAAGGTAGGTAAAAGGTAGGTAAAAGGTAGGTAAAAGGTAAAGSTAAAGGAAGAAGGTAGGIVAGGWIVIVIIVIIIVLIGLIGFLFNMPGLMVGKLKEIAQNLWDGFQSAFITQADAFINDDDIVKLGQYLEDMDYDLVGYGFVRPNYEDFKTYLEVEAEGYYKSVGGIYYKNAVISGAVTTIPYNRYYYDANEKLIDNNTGKVVEDWYKDDYGILYWAKDGEKDGVSYSKGDIYSLDGGVDVSLLRMYLMADYRITVLRNDDEQWTNEIWETLNKTFGGSPNAWSKGLIKLYVDHPTKGLIDYSSIEGIENFWWDDAQITDSGTKLSIRNGWFNKPMDFELDGWTGRYGLSLEFLLSLHLGTMAPDLVTAMVQCFDTEVQVYLERITAAEIKTKYVDYKSDEDVTVEWINDVLEANGNFFKVGSTDFKTVTDWYNALVLSKKACQVILKGLDGERKLSAAPDCLKEYQPELIENSTKNGDLILFGKNVSETALATYEFEDDRIMDYLKDIEQTYANYKVYKDKESVKFDINNCVLAYTEDDKQAWVDNKEKTYFSDTQLAEYGYDKNDLEVNDTNIIYEYTTMAQKVRAPKETYGEDGITADNFIQNTFKLTLVETTKEWVTDFTDTTGTYNEEQWIALNSYKLIIERPKFDLYEGAVNHVCKYTCSSPDKCTSDNHICGICSNPSKCTTNYQYIETRQNNKVDRVYVWEFVVRDKTLAELEAEGAIVDGELDPDRVVCGSPTDTNDKCCSNCKRYVSYTIRALAEVADDNYDYYQPYIARVVGSWFRDTYFIIPKTEDYALKDYYGVGNSPKSSYGDEGEYIKVDEEYLNSSGEYWTEYEMKEDPTTGEKTYQLYYLNPDGSTSNKKLEDWLKEEHAGQKYNSQEEAEQDGYVFVKKPKLLDIDDVKENTQKEDDDGGGRDMDKSPYIDENLVWAAYTLGDGGSTGWVEITENGDGDNNKHMEKIWDLTNNEGKFYYKIDSTKSVEQEEDAIRTETNITVKNLFRYRQFYIYDGTDSKAKAIEDDRNKVITMIKDYWDNSSYKQSHAVDDLAKYGRYALREAYSWSTFTIFTNEDDVAESWLDYQLDMYYRAGNEDSMTNEEKERFKLDELCEFGINNTYENEEGDEVTYLDKEYYTSEDHSLDPRNRNLISTVNITKSSLDAFSILENVNTLDADYQYRDFKELIVELNYFDKEDLSEAIEEVFTWLVPSYTTRWPILAVDKQDIEYGTLVHSQDTIDFLIKVYEKLVAEEQALAEDVSDEDVDVDAGESESEDKVDMSKVYYIGDSWFVALKNNGITESPASYFTAEVGKKAGDSVYDNISVKSDASAIVVMLGLNGATTQEQMKDLLEELSTKYSSKNIYVLKVFHVGKNYTVMNKDTLNAQIDTYNKDISEFCSTKDNLKFVDATTDLIGSDGYLNSVYESGDGMHLTTEGYKILYKNIKNLVESGEGRAETQNEQILSQLKESQSYAENDVVISPVTGKIISYGEHKRINVYTQEYETVGYVEIEIMGFGEDKKDSSASYFTKDMLSETSLTNEEKEEAVKGLNAFYDEYKDQNAGYTLMIDGIDITDLKNGFTSLTDAEGNAVEYDALCQYQADEVTALYNSKEQKRREEEAEAKQNAPYLITYNANYSELDGEYNAPDGLGGYYVKEGAYLGKTQSATTRTGDTIMPNEGVQKDQPNLSDDSVLVEENPEKTTDIRKVYEEFLEEDKNPDYLRMILLDTKSTYVDNVEDYFPGYEEFISNAELDIDLLTLLIDSWENAAVMDYIWDLREYDSYVAKYITKDKKYFICYYDLTWTRNYGCGVCHQPNVDISPNKFYHVEEYKKVGVDITKGHSEPGVSKCEVSKVIEVQSMLIQNTFVAKVEAILEKNGITLQQHQKDALTDTVYQYGTSCLSDFVAAYKSGNPESFFTSLSSDYSVRNENRLHLYKTGEYLNASGVDLKEKLKQIGGSLN